MPQAKSFVPSRYNTLVSNIVEEPEKERGFFGDLADSYALGVYGQIKDQFDRMDVDAEFDPSFDPLNNIPLGYGQYAEDMRYARSQAELDVILQNIDENNEIRARQENYSFGYNLLIGAITGIVDPVNLINPSLKGASFLAGAAKGALVYGSLNAGQEVIRNELDPTSSNVETAFNIGAGYLLSGLATGAAAYFSKADIDKTRLDSDSYNRVNTAGDNYDRAVSAVDNLASVENLRFGEQDVKIVYGNTGKYDRTGNYISAFFRSADAARELVRRGNVQRAADDALGPIIPDGDEAVFDPSMFDEMDAGYLRSLEEDAGSAPTATEAAVPTGRTTSEGETPRTGEDATSQAEFEDIIYIDDAAILNTFDDKPWTKPRVPGVEPLPEDAFKNPAEWLNFVVRHELHHKTSKQLPNESKPEYETRINNLAYQDIQAGRTPLSPTDSFLEQVMLAPTLQGEAMRLAPRNAYVHEAIQNTGGDMATIMVGNRMNLPTTPGGSVFQKAQRWLVANYVLKVATDAAYVKYVTGKAGGGVAGNAAESFVIGLPVVGRAKRTNKLSQKEFREYIGRAAQTDRRFNMHGKPITDDEHGIIMEASNELRQLLKQFGDEAEKLGMFEVQKRIGRDIDRLQKNIARRTEKLGKYTGDLRTKVEAEIKDSEGQLAALVRQQDEMQANPIMPSREKYYFPRIYDLSKIREKLDEFTSIITAHFGGDEAARGRANEWIDKLLNGGGEDDFAPGAGGPVNTLSRQITLTNEDLADFIVWDSEIVMGVYSRRMGASIEMVKAYGSRMQEDLIDDMVMRLRDDNVPEDRIAKIVRLQEDVRDRVLGRFHAKDPMSWDNRTARAIKNFTNITVMGRGIFSQVTDIARALAINGYAPLFKAMHTAMRGEVRDLATGRYAKQAGEALELVNARWMASLIENDSALTVTQQTALERGLAAAQSPFFRFNLMNPFTVIWKDFTGIMSSHTLIDESITVANAIRSGKTLNTLSKSEKRIADRLASFGIDIRSAQLIADMPFEKTGGDLYLANIEKWGESGRSGAKAKKVFLGALSGQIRSGVVTPGPLQRANIMDGVFYVKGKRVEQPLLSLPFQLLSFTLSSSAKVTHSLLSGRDRNRAVTLASLYMAGMFATYLKSGGNWDKKTWEEVTLESFENSSIAGYLTDIYRRTEDLTGYGPRSAMGAYEFGADTVSDEIGAVAGPGVSVIAGAIEAFINPDLEDRQRAGLVRRAVPFSGMWLWNDTMREMSNWAADAGWIEGPDSEPSEFNGEEAVFEDTIEQIMSEEQPQEQMQMPQ
jgi:hypothetical protein